MRKNIVIVPCYNEAKRLQQENFQKFLASGSPFDILFVNDGSTDETSALLKNFCEQNERANLLDMSKNQGKAEAVRLGLIEATKHEPAIIGYLDADLATSLEEAGEMVQFLQTSQYQAVFGSRINRLGSDIQRNMIRHYFGRVFATITSIILNLAIYDTQCGAKFFKSSPEVTNAINPRFISKWVFDVELIKRLQAQGWKKGDMYEWPLKRWHDIAGSKVRLIDVIRALYDLFRIAGK